MNLTEEQILSFQAVWKAATGQEIDAATAREFAPDIIGLVEIVYKNQRPRTRDPPP